MLTNKLTALLTVLFLTLTALGQGTTNIKLGTHNVPITSVKLTYNGSTITQTAGHSVSTQTSLPVNLLEVNVNDGGTIKTLDHLNLNGSKIRNNNFTSSVTGVGVYDKGSVTLASNPTAFESAMDSVVGGPNLLSYLYYDGASNIPTGDDFDMLWAYGLNKDDYIIVAERDGNTFFTLTPLDSTGNPITGASKLKFGRTNGTFSSNGNRKYDWNIGYRPTNINQPMYMTAVSIELFNTSKSIHGIRIDNNGDADVKFFGASDDPFDNNEITTVIGSISGTVYIDDNINAYVDGQGSDSASGNPMYVSLVNSSGTVVGTTPPDTGGHFEFVDLTTDTYKVVLHNNPSGSATSSPPSGWYFRGEVLGDTAGHDGTKDGYIMAVGVTDSLVPNARFGVFSAPLSVEWLAINSNAIDKNSNVITWSTSSEKNSDYYIVERSIDGLYFEKIGEVLAIGNSSEITNYSFTDLTPNGTKNLYRVKLINTDATSDFSPTTYVVGPKSSNNVSFKIFPNPAVSVANISFNSLDVKDCEFAIYNQFGVVVETDIKITGNSIALDVASMSNGIYIVSTTYNGSTTTKRLIINH